MTKRQTHHGTVPALRTLYLWYVASKGKIRRLCGCIICALCRGSTTACRRETIASCIRTSINILYASTYTQENSSGENEGPKHGADKQSDARFRLHAVCQYLGEYPLLQQRKKEISTTDRLYEHPMLFVPSCPHDLFTNTHDVKVSWGLSHTSVLVLVHTSERT